MGEMSDYQWQAIAELFPEEKRTKGGRPRVSDRQVLNGVLWVLKTGSQWAQLPQKYGAYVTVWRRFREWEDLGLWEKIWLRLLPTLERKEQLEWMLAFWDGKFVPGRKGRE
jgi:transposase